MYEPTDRYQNWFITSLQTDINDTTSSFRLNKALNVQQGRLVIDPYDETNREIVKVTSVDGTLVYVERGDDHTAPAYHNEGAIVVMDVFAADLNDLYADWALMQVELQEALDDTIAATAAAVDATADSVTATNNANTATGLANTATANANAATSAANDAASDANAATLLADSAAADASAAAADANAAATAAESIVATAFLAGHPVDSIYITVNPTNPGTLYGGTWVAWGSGRVPVGVDAGQTDFNTVEKLSGSMKHRHRGYGQGEGGGFATGDLRAAIGAQASDANRIGYAAVGADVVAGGSRPAGTYSGTWNSPSSGRTDWNHFTPVYGYTSEQSSLQPAIAVYMWKRTA